jgi:hypothetical protein
MTFVKGTTLWHVVRSIGHEITTVCGRHLSADMPTANGLSPAPRRAEAHLEGVPPPPGSRNPGNRLLQCRNDPATDPVTCCCSSRSGPGGYMSLVSPDTPARRGSPSRRGTWRWGAARADPVPDPGSGLQVLRSFDEVFLTEGVKVIQTPIQAPRRVRGAVGPHRPGERLDWLPVLGRRHLSRVLRAYAAHYNRAGPHRGLDLRTPEPRPDPLPRPSDGTQVRRQDVLGGLIHE